MSLCNKDVTGHRSTWSFPGIESETDLILARVGIFSVTSRDLSSFNIRPFHCSELGIGLPRNSYSSLCQVPKEIANHIERRGKPVKADRGVGKNISEYIHQQTGILIPVGSGTVGLIIVLYAYKFLRLPYLFGYKPISAISRDPKLLTQKINLINTNCKCIILGYKPRAIFGLEVYRRP